jgi:hypothetical protein
VDPTSLPARPAAIPAPLGDWDVFNTVISYGLAAPPAVTQVTPATGPAGTTVTVTGTGFSEATAVSFGGTPATFTPIGNYLVTVTTPYGTSVSPTPVYVAYEGPHLD